MTTIVVDHETEKGLKTLADLTGKSEPDILREAVTAYLEDLQDAREADRVLDRIEAGEEGTLTLEEMERRLDLDG
ncbi:MAG: CopG family transcriptional regulator [Pseudomonadota bacterium]|nr:CopG family transcriptional regulator [Pseudomonadota bacterium]